ncbi:CDP-glycerol glycerophosphotransferase [Thermocatellispora tengchongensis]|uniref:CDP-glycerol glycerophosphotransferase n=1 Tax=Thermocatellispora tengchongensis TaxID=1073253 RepID=A0A840PMT7_9ACTN|nr:glycosyltransferase family 2 protein [Thermocatellispora tengchongensis]MBB5139333.1 CDP-glycerol glycerophosphotransferase [Thermocatellispora tengchongensis]
MAPLLSVVVPFHNVVAYLEECLTSLASQTLDDLEVVMVDDGSADGSRTIADVFAAWDPRFVLVGTGANVGPGPARNLGIEAATGRYLAFADADDVLPRDAYERLVRALEDSGSDLACGGVQRLESGTLGPSPLHARTFRRGARRTHITRAPKLVRDRTVWNKVYRRSFWDACGLSFPPGLYEDLPVALEAHVRASAVDVVPEVVYHWRLRESGASSITQRRTEAANIAERLASVRTARSLLARRAPALLAAYDGMVASWDLAIVAKAVEAAAEPDRSALLGLVGAYVDQIDGEAVRGLPAIRRLELYLLRHGMVGELAEVRRSRREHGGRVRVVPRGLREARWFAAYPYYGDRARRIPAHLYDVTEELELRAGVERVSWRGRSLAIEGYAYIRHAEDVRTRMKLWLVSPGTQERIPVVTFARTRRPHPDGADGPATGFVATLNRKLVKELRGRWSLHVELTGPRGLRREGPVKHGTLRRRQLRRAKRARAGLSDKVSDKATGKESVRTVSQGG